MALLLWHLMKWVMLKCGLPAATFKVPRMAAEVNSGFRVLG